MREINFRAWNEVEGFLDTAWSIDFEHRLVCHRAHNQSDLDDCVLMQYTGLQDKNGREIYEGDITIDGYGTVTVIENDGFQWLERIVRLRDRHISKEILIMTKANAFRCEVIGNIYENPELLEVKENE
ncbi:YopX family protein [Kurthia populi]|uniref:YopX family protein n=1 Tax=Kurthia populi TaxID=1562132 RepID=A0ABW5Y3G5_9BACL